MSWAAITANEVHSRINATEKTAFNAILQVTGQSDPMTETIGLVTNLVRGYAQKQVSSPPASGVPPELKDAAVDLVIYRLAQRVSNAHAEQRKPAADAAMELLRDVAKGDFVIASDDGDVAIPGATIKDIHGDDPPEREFTRENQEGI